MDRWQALYSFWAAYGYPTYEENSVPDLDDLTFPYLTYEARVAPFNGDVTANASVWTRNISWNEADGISDAIEESLKHGGLVQRYDGGIIWVTADENNFAQGMGDPTDDLIKRKLLSITYHFN